jgi:ribosome-associated toxin RatA of RatAB toxin-antitoxin module
VRPLTLALLLLVGADDSAKHLEAGEVLITSEAVEGSGMPRVKVDAIIEAPPEKVWAVIEDCGTYEKTMPRIKSSKVLERDGGTMVCRVTASAPFPVGDLTAETRAVLTVEPGVRYERRWSLIAGDYTTNTGGWLLTPYQGDPKRTRVHYEIHVEPKVHLPDAILSSGQRRSLGDLFARLRELTVSR